MLVTMNTDYSRKGKWRVVFFLLPTFFLPASRFSLLHEHYLRHSSKLDANATNLAAKEILDSFLAANLVSSILTHPKTKANGEGDQREGGEAGSTNSIFADIYTIIRVLADDGR